MKWIKRYDKTINTYLDSNPICSNCNHECFTTFYDNEPILTPYCPWCGEKAEKKDIVYIEE